LSEAQIYQRLSAQGIDGVVADRLAQARREEAVWRSRYDAYAQQRDHINSFPGLSGADRAAQVTQLRQQIFTASGEVLRAQATPTVRSTWRTIATMQSTPPSNTQSRLLCR